MAIPGFHREIKTALAAHGLRLIDIARKTGIAYDRLTRIVNGYRQPRPGEIDRIREAIQEETVA